MNNPPTTRQHAALKEHSLVPPAPERPDPSPGVTLPGPPLSAPTPSTGSRGGWRRAWAIVGIVAGFIELTFLTIPGWLALRSYRRWRKGERDNPLFAWIWAWISAGLVTLGIAGLALGVAIPNQLLTANFDRGAGPFTVTTIPGFSTDLVDGTYRIRILAQEGSPARSFANLGREAGAVAVSADVVEVSGSGPDDLVGLECGRSNGDGYLFAAGTTGGFGIGKGIGNDFTSLRLDETAPIPSPGRIERLRLTCVGSPSGPTKLYASINGSTVATVTDPHGLGTFTTVALAFEGANGDQARFDNVLARVPTSQDY